MNSKKGIDICYALNDGYVKYCGVGMVSVLENNRDSSITFHILTDSLSDKSRQYLDSIVQSYGATVRYYIMEDGRLKGQKTTWSKYGWYRIFASDVIDSSVDRLLYLDCDTVVCGSIKDLFELPGNDWSLAAVPDYMTIFPALYERIGYDRESGYFCSGVLMMNLDYFRKNNLAERILRYAIEHPERIHFPDQDALNCVCKDSKIMLPLKFGILDPFFRKKPFISEFKEDVKDSLSDPRIIHYAGCAPWIAESHHHYYEDEFWKYAKIAGGVSKKHYCSGLSLILLTMKRNLSYLGLKRFNKYRIMPKPAYDDIIELIDE